MTGTGPGRAFAPAVGLDAIALASMKAPAPRVRAAIKTKRYRRRMGASLTPVNPKKCFAIYDVLLGYTRLVLN
jgi:hypothetical protein